MEKVNLQVPLGYCIQNSKKVVSVDEARKILLTKKQKRYSYAERDDTTVTLARDFLKCPNCNFFVPYLPNDLNHCFGVKRCRCERIPRNIIENWTTQQTSLFSEQYYKLVLNHTDENLRDVVCPRCKDTIHYNEKKRKVEFIRHRHKIKIRSQMVDIAELFSLPSIKSGQIHVSFPLFECVTFNFNKGHTVLSLETEEGDALAIRDITYDREIWTIGVLYNLLTKNKNVKRTIRRLFEKEWESNLPYVTSEIGPQELRLMCMFKGFNRNFYSSIPFDNNTFKIEKTFKETASKLRNAKEIIQMYEESDLPKMKSVKKLFFNNQGLVFYIKECENIWKHINDPNLFVGLLSSDSIYSILVDLHSRPLLFDFIRDYSMVRGKVKCMQKLKTTWPDCRVYAINYSTMSQEMREKEQNLWVKNRAGTSLRFTPSFSIPMHKPNYRIKNCNIDGFTFSWLLSSNDYKETGDVLYNCLRAWHPEGSPVISVRDPAGKLVGAIEIRNNDIIQAKTIKNRSIETVPKFSPVFKKWIEKYGLSTRYYCSDDIEDFVDDDDEVQIRRYYYEELPF